VPSLSLRALSGKPAHGSVAPRSSWPGLLDFIARQGKLSHRSRAIGPLNGAQRFANRSLAKGAAGASVSAATCDVRSYRHRPAGYGQKSPSMKTTGAGSVAAPRCRRSQRRHVWPRRPHTCQHRPRTPLFRGPGAPDQKLPGPRPLSEEDIWPCPSQKNGVTLKI